MILDWRLGVYNLLVKILVYTGVVSRYENVCYDDFPGKDEGKVVG